VANVLGPLCFTGWSKNVSHSRIIYRACVQGGSKNGYPDLFLG